MLINCPVCGLRDHQEFTYDGDATVRRPALDNKSEADWNAYVYERENPKGPHREFWHHAHGCRHWLVVERDTATHEISEVRLIGPWAEAISGGER